MKASDKLTEKDKKNESDWKEEKESSFRESMKWVLDGTPALSFTITLSL